MTITSVTRDPDRLTMTVTVEFADPVERVWQLWADPRQLERWWGPPTYPATVDAHDLVPGGKVSYAMTGPDGDKHFGWWRVLTVDAPHLLEVEDGFADDSGTPNPALPTTVLRVELFSQGSGTRVVMVSTFPSAEAMQQMIDMGLEDGMRGSLGQMDGVLAG